MQLSQWLEDSGSQYACIIFITVKKKKKHTQPAAPMCILCSHEQCGHDKKTISLRCRIVLHMFCFFNLDCPSYNQRTTGCWSGFFLFSNNWSQNMNRNGDALAEKWSQANTVGEAVWQRVGSIDASTWRRTTSGSSIWCTQLFSVLALLNLTRLLWQRCNVYCYYYYFFKFLHAFFMHFTIEGKHHLLMTLDWHRCCRCRKLQLEVGLFYCFISVYLGGCEKSNLGLCRKCSSALIKGSQALLNISFQLSKRKSF